MTLRGGLIIFYFNFIVFHISAQENGGLHSVLNSKWRLGFTPSAIVNTYSGIQLSGEYAISDRFSIVTEAAYIFYDLNQENNLQGFRLRPQCRFKILKSESAETSVSFLYNYRYTSHDVTAELSRANGAYIETVKGKRATYYRGVGLMLQQDFLLDKTGINIGIGAGPGTVQLKDSNPETENLQNDRYRFWFRRNNARNFIVPLVILHFNIYFY